MEKIQKQLPCKNFLLFLYWYYWYSTIRAKEVIITDQDWADFVFEDGYRLPSLQEAQAHIQEKGHLPGIPSAAEVAQEGRTLGEMQRLMMQKIEELTLHMIEKEKQFQELQKRSPGGPYPGNRTEPKQINQHAIRNDPLYDEPFYSSHETSHYSPISCSNG